MTADELVAAWHERDHRYQRRRVSGLAHPLSENERRLVRDLRLAEIQSLPARERAKAWAAWRTGVVG